MTVPLHLDPAAPQPIARPTRIARAARVAIGLVLMTAGTLITLNAGAFRAFEASAAARVAKFFTHTATYVATDSGSFYWGMGTGHAHGLRLTPECSVAYIVGPLCIVFGGLVSMHRLRVSRVLGGLLVGAASLFLTNLARISMISFSIQRWDSDVAFWWSHIVIGSLFALCGSIASIALAVWIAFGRTRRAARRDRPAPAVRRQA